MANIIKATASVDVYDMDVIFWHCSVEKAKQLFKRTPQSKHKIEIDFDTMNGCCIQACCSDHPAIVWLLDSTDPIQKKLAILSHEIFHCIGCALTIRGIDYDVKNDEPYAYMLSYLFEQAVTKLKLL